VNHGNHPSSKKYGGSGQSGRRAGENAYEKAPLKRQAVAERGSRVAARQRASMKGWKARVREEALGA